VGQKKGGSAANVLFWKKRGKEKARSLPYRVKGSPPPRNGKGEGGTGLLIPSDGGGGKGGHFQLASHSKERGKTFHFLRKRRAA